ncbi:NAD(P)-binding protein [Lophium mytilinum]|uniref:NAD(P)-binding protein n=1 Tax=Lophium mytilinum TaxID=390894 RepID=A0A6A6QGV7_9PEZI|nr:NAD(P)-binding protein [Lophium mytilinum]
MATSNHLTKIAIVGAGGNSGRFITEALLKTGKHTITALTRTDSQSKLPEGALRGQDALIITLSGFAPKVVQTQLINAAGEAGVGWILPNEWAPDTANEVLVQDSLSMPAAFGIDFANHTATLFDEGETKISVSTWPQIGCAVAALLSLPINSEGSNKEDCLENFRNKLVYVNSFTVSQRDMLESALRVTGTKEEDWTVTKEPAQERYSTGIEQIEEGQRIGYAKMMYTRVFYPDGCGDTEHNRGTLNSLLGLPKEDIDEATNRAIERSKGSTWV